MRSEVQAILKENDQLITLFRQNPHYYLIVTRFPFEIQQLLKKEQREANRFQSFFEELQMLHSLWSLYHSFEDS